ncbi:hypothetical protein [Halopseudomonas pelagia]|uniref:hypothetical protein n=1 Tax=Halopseudomonas pelagia TaxID=553151 RepID=UPI0030DAD709|tara:strand:- start:179 stop:907 length:729 start_codon:yes stop_codon:yes gene_type:complete
MAVNYYGPGEHSAGFIGFHVTARFNGDFYQRYFNTLPAQEQSDEDVYFLYRRLEAELQDLEWQRESLQNWYERFVTENHANTLPERGVGVHGITAAFTRQGRGSWRACFMVARYQVTGTPRQPVKTYTFFRPYTEVWNEAVTFWAEEHGIRSADMERVLKSPPDPEQFKRLRRQMNEDEGYDIPVEALSSVFAEQRSMLAQQRAVLKAKRMKLHVGVPSPLKADIQAEMAAWFESVTRTDQK